MIEINEEKKQEIERSAFKENRVDAVDRILVTTAGGLTFDGDEVSQGRMARTIIGLQSQPEATTVKWVLSDNSVADVGIQDLQEALALAVKRQTELWVKA